MPIMMRAYEHCNSETIFLTELTFDECVKTHSSKYQTHSSCRKNYIDFRKKSTSGLIFNLFSNHIRNILRSTLN